MLEFARVKDVKAPERGTSASAGIDFFIPNSQKPVTLLPHKRVKIPSGIHVKIPHGYALAAFNKSGVSIKKGIMFLAGLIDEDYQGEIEFVLFNTNDYAVTVHPGEKIIQFVLLPVYYAWLREDTLDSLYTEKTERGTRGFGEGTGG